LKRFYAEVGVLEMLVCEMNPFTKKRRNVKWLETNSATKRCPISESNVAIALRQHTDGNVMMLVRILKCKWRMENTTIEAHVGELELDRVAMAAASPAWRARLSVTMGSAFSHVRARFCNF
jgi:hypothetical protein